MSNVCLVAVSRQRGGRIKERTLTKLGAALSVCGGLLSATGWGSACIADEVLDADMLC